MFPKKNALKAKPVNSVGFDYKKSRTPSGRGSVSGGWSPGYTPPNLGQVKKLKKGKTYIDGVLASKFK